MKPLYDYTAHRWRLPTKYNKTKGLYLDYDGAKFSEMDCDASRTEKKAIALLSEDTKALCASADYCKSPEDFDDWLDPMALIPAEEKLVAWRSLSARTRQGLTAAKERRLADTAKESTQQLTAAKISPQEAAA